MNPLFQDSQFWLQWLTIIGPVIGLFLYVHRENVQINTRLDTHMHEINKRCDDLHREFYELLKQMRKE